MLMSSISVLISLMHLAFSFILTIYIGFKVCYIHTSNHSI